MPCLRLQLNRPFLPESGSFTIMWATNVPTGTSSGTEDWLVSLASRVLTVMCGAWSLRSLTLTRRLAVEGTDPMPWSRPPLSGGRWRHSHSPLCPWQTPGQCCCWPQTGGHRCWLSGTQTVHHLPIVPQSASAASHLGNSGQHWCVLIYGHLIGWLLKHWGIIIGILHLNVHIHGPWAWPSTSIIGQHLQVVVGCGLPVQSVCEGQQHLPGSHPPPPAPAGARCLSRMATELVPLDSIGWAVRIHGFRKQEGRSARRVLTPAPWTQCWAPGSGGVVIEVQDFDLGFDDLEVLVGLMATSRGTHRCKTLHRERHGPGVHWWSCNPDRWSTLKLAAGWVRNWKRKSERMLGSYLSASRASLTISPMMDPGSISSLTW